MPLPPALAAKLAKRGLIQTSTSARRSRVNKEKENGDRGDKDKEDKDKPRFVEEVIAESYDDPKRSSSSSSHHNKGIPSNSANHTPLGLANRRSGALGVSKFQRMGHYGCPNKTNIYHSCTSWCVERWGKGAKDPDTLYNKRRLKMLKKYPIPSGWIEIYDPGAARYYYWHAETDNVSWMSPTHPQAKIGPSASELRETWFAQHKQELQRQEEQSASDLMRKSLRKLDKKRSARRPPDELDPMDPASYSECPRGNWQSGLRADEKSGVDTTASGPLFQQRPYPSPGDILRAKGGGQGK